MDNELVQGLKERGLDTYLAKSFQASHVLARLNTDRMELADSVLKAMDTAEVAGGAEFMPTAFSPDLINQVRLDLKVSSIFPSTADTESVIDTAALVEAVKRVALVAERNTPVRLRFTDGQVTIEAGAGDDAQASEAVEAVLTGPEIEIAFNPQFLLDGLGAVGTAYSRLSFTQSGRPAVLMGQAELDGDADTSYRYVLMPVRFAS